MLTNCKITLAESAGFCFGVDRAIKLVYNSLDTRGKVVTLGPIIHNAQVVDDLKNRGVFPVESVEDVPHGYSAIIRSHGVPQETYDLLSEKKIDIIDATCPFVKRIHRIVAEKSSDGYTILIAGDKNHPEVCGIVGHSKSEAYVFENLSELKNIFEKNIVNDKKKVAIIAQTTYNIKLWEVCKKYVEENYPQCVIFDTICNATSLRQSEAINIAKESDVMIIVGSMTSSNTNKLQAVCEPFCRSYHIENASQLFNIDFSNVSNIGISAGASTPAYIIKEVQTTMSEILKNQDEEFNFEEAMEQSLKKIYTGNRVKGYITAVNSNEAIVDIGTKHTGYVPMSELSDDPNATPSDIVKVGDEIDLIVTKINDQEGIVTLSKKKVDAMVGFETIIKAKESGETLTGVVVNVVKGGILVSSNGVKVFIPASQATMRRDDKLEELLRKNVDFKIIEVNEVRSRAVGSIKAVLKDKRSALETKFFEAANAGDVITGEVKSITDYGVFVDLGGVDGLIRKSDLAWNRIKHPSDVVSVGEKIEVSIKDIDKENKKVSLVYKKESDNPWSIFNEKYEVGSVVNVKIVSITQFGAFAEIIPGIDGLIHISQIANQRVNNVADMLSVGQTVDAKITEIDLDKKRISLSMRALIEESNDEASDAE